MRIKAKDLAQILGVTKVTVSRWENGKEQLSPACDRLIRFLYENRIFKQVCELGIEKLESSTLKSMLAMLCEPRTSLEEVFKNIKRRQIHSKIAIPIPKLDFFARALDSYLGVEFKGVSFKSEQVSSNSGIDTDIRLEHASRGALRSYLEVVTTVGLPNIGIGTTVDDILTQSLTPPTMPSKGGWASA
jgi:transcriptional regulator with XRE-family HTH domain